MSVNIVSNIVELSFLDIIEELRSILTDTPNEYVGRYFKVKHEHFNPRQIVEGIAKEIFEVNDSPGSFLSTAIRALAEAGLQPEIGSRIALDISTWVTNRVTTCIGHGPLREAVSVYIDLIDEYDMSCILTTYQTKPESLE